MSNPTQEIPMTDTLPALVGELQRLAAYFEHEGERFNAEVEERWWPDMALACGDAAKRLPAAIHALTTQQAEIASLKSALAEQERVCGEMRAALEPSAENKAAYMGRFNFPFSINVAGKDVTFTPNVPWVTIKSIMAAIRARAVLNGGKTDV